MKTLIFSILLIALAVVLVRYGIRRITILEYERGLLYVRGRFQKILEPGQYWHTPLTTLIHKCDIRPRFVSVTGQEVLSADGVTLKVSLAAHYEITDLLAATTKAQDFQNALYLELQLALREIIGAADIDAVLNNRSAFSQQLQALTETKAQALGLKLIAVNLKDILFPGKLKEVFAQVVSARKEGLALLEKARGEAAALRSLANAARLLEANPHLLSLRLAQSLGQSSGNSLVFGVPPAALAVARRPVTSPPAASAADVEQTAASDPS